MTGGSGRDRLQGGFGNDSLSGERRRIRNCEFVDIRRRFRSNKREISPR